jgi:hypothetical protein
MLVRLFKYRKKSNKCTIYVSKKRSYNLGTKAIWPSGKAVDCKFSIPSSNLGVALKFYRGYGGMVDTPDLKSVDLYGRESSSLSTPNSNYI